jgi:enoyl-CoA hydratase/carnithine racemase
MSGPLKISKDDHVATVTLNRPEKHNAVNLDMFAALAEAGADLSADKSVRAIILEGEGASFCAGIDLSVFQQGEMSQLASKMTPEDGAAANFFQRAAYIWREVPVPVICVVHGAAYGAGLQIALGADLRYASPDSRLSVMEIKWGIIPDMAISKTLARIVPADRAKELAWTGRVFGAEEALQLGVVSAVCDDPKQAALETAQAVAARSPSAVRAIKRLFDESPELSVAEAFRLEAELQMSLLGSANQAEAVRANMENRAAKFED